MSDGKPITSYPWYVPDWQSSETRIKLSLAQRGLFRELLDHCHSEGSIPDDMVLLARMCAASLKEVKRLFPALRDQFVKEGNRLVNPKAAEVRAKLFEYHEGRKKAGTTGAKKRWAESRELPPSTPRASRELPPSGLRRKPSESAGNDKTGAESAKLDGSAIAEPSLSYSLPQPLPQPQPFRDLKTCSPGGEQQPILPAPPSTKSSNWGPKEKARAFRESFWPRWPRKVARADAERAWVKHATTPEIAEKIVKAAKDQTAMLTGDGLKFCPYPASWLNARRYLDDPGEAPLNGTGDPAAGGPQYTDWKPAWDRNTDA